LVTRFEASLRGPAIPRDSWSAIRRTRIPHCGSACSAAKPFFGHYGRQVRITGRADGSTMPTMGRHTASGRTPFRGYVCRTHLSGNPTFWREQDLGQRSAAEFGELVLSIISERNTRGNRSKCRRCCGRRSECQNGVTEEAAELGLDTRARTSRRICSDGPFIPRLTDQNR
jgi:hypothetical protein